MFSLFSTYSVYMSLNDFVSYLSLVFNWVMIMFTCKLAINANNYNFDVMTAFYKIFKECFWKIKLLGPDMDRYWLILLMEKQILFAICTTLTFFLWNTFYYALYHTRYTVCCTNINILLTYEEPWTRFLSKHVSLLKDQWVCLLQTLVEIIMHLLFLFFFLSVYPSLCCFFLTHT